MTSILTIIGAILIFSVIVTVHEFGHFITARMAGVTVHEFAIGMGPAIFKRTSKKNITYSIRILPIGGYCQIEGEDEDSEDEGSFSKKKPLPRIIILAAGAFMNLLLGFLVVLSLTITTAFPNGGLPSTVVEEVNPDSGVADFLKPGDKIIAVNGNRINIKRDLAFELSKTGGAEAELTILRGKEKITKAFSPMEVTYEDGSKGYVVGFNVTMDKITPWGILKESFFQTVWMVKLVFVSLGMLFSGQAGLGDLSGPVGVVHAMNTVAQSGFLNLLFFGAFLAVNIGIMNLLPLPALDGGRILFVLIELIFRKPIPKDKEGWVHFVGFALLILLMIYATWNDIVRIFLN